MIFSKTKFFISFCIILIFLPTTIVSDNKQIVDYGIISLMYHRFEENKYPSTNIKIDDFKTQLSLIKESGFNFVNPKAAASCGCGKSFGM